MKYLYNILLAVLFPCTVWAQGTVYLVLGSDTAIWDGLDVNDYHTTLGVSLYDNPSENAYTVMNPAFRDQLKDSYGTTMKMTWWMMAGNMYRYATNTNVPLPNVMTMYLMKKYHGDNIERFGDELTLHYHTFVWTDYDGDGRFYWNQAKNFTETRSDFDVTLAQFLLDENVFPASFRSGWHYMDNEWQNYIDPIIPYCLHNDYPNVRLTDPEPIDNIYDWSKASKEYVPFHPSLSNYQLPGNGKSWDTRSRYMASFSQANMDTVFAKAARGIDQTPCLWAHLPESDFPQNMKRIDSLAHNSAAKYPTVKFRYCTAVEAMQRWRHGTDTIPPVVTLTEVPSGGSVSFTINSNEDIFQAEPFVAMKDINEQYSILHCTKTAPRQWSTTDAIPRWTIAKVGVAVTDTMGNASIASLNFVPDDRYLDNDDPSYSELSGAWSANSARAWGTDSRQCVIGTGDTAAVQWTFDVADSGTYNLFFQIPSLQNPVTSLGFTIVFNGTPIDSVLLAGPFAGMTWNYIATVHFQQPGAAAITMSAYGAGQEGKILSADVIKVSGLVKDRQIFSRESDIFAEPISEDDSTIVTITVENRGINDLTISDIYSVQNSVGIGQSAPIVLHGMKKQSIPLILYSNSIGDHVDSIAFVSDDPQQPVYMIALHFSVQPYFRLVDNADSIGYEEFGPWSTSNSQAWKSSSRYATPGSGAQAVFTAQMKRNGLYDIYEIVPITVNAVTDAVYTVVCYADTIGTAIVDQNKGSGNWASIGQYQLSAGDPVSVRVSDSGPSSGRVLRADAVKFQLKTASGVSTQRNDEVNTFALDQNYPNPFNPTTVIRFSVPMETFVTLSVYDMLGREVRTIVRDVKQAGGHTVLFDASGLASGMYIYRIAAGAYMKSKVMMLLK